ncbi:MAG: hypothetical protein KKB82_08055 [Candidatus Omnitrophica bacterium]|nr:hypothetical protein [Candidatus Omnitrophota bacterium]MBU1925856.1 hypothetical protein [Candidatus Omnitrophota bacterium]
MSKILNYNCEGMWIANYKSYYAWAYYELELFDIFIKKLILKEKNIRAKNVEANQDDLESLVLYETKDLQNVAYMHAITSFLYLCMSIEGFLNFYGTRRLSEKYYKRNIEKMRITEKLSNIFLSCCSVVIDPDDVMLIKLRKLFDVRNSLVHPKTKEIAQKNMNNFIQAHPARYKIKEYFKDGECIIDMICGFDPSIDKDFEFQRFKPAGKKEIGTF